MLSVIIPSYGRPGLLRDALSSVAANSTKVREVIVLSPQSKGEYAEICSAFSARLVDDGSRSKGVRVKSLWQILNGGIELAAGPYVCWLSDDCTVVSGWDMAALSPFKHEDCGLVSLRTQHLEVGNDFRFLETLHGTICANYGVLLKSSGIRFDERFSWFHGDADIALQTEFIYRKRVYGTEEPCVVHQHVADQTRAGNEADPRTKQDWIYLNNKWRGYSRIGSLKIAGLPARLINGVRYLTTVPGRAFEKLSRILGLVRH